MTSTVIDWCRNESILRGRLVGGHLGGLINFGGCLPKFLGHFQQIINKFVESSAQVQSIGTLVG
jgi:hypothetical protein